MEMTRQVADVTKPLPSAMEMTDAGNLVFLHWTGGIVKKLSLEPEKKVWCHPKSPAKACPSNKMEVDAIQMSNRYEALWEEGEESEFQECSLFHRL